MIRRMIWILIGLAVVAGFAWALWPKPVPVRTAPVSRQDIEVVVEEEGESRIREVFTVSAPISGQMARLDLHAGDSVTAGETVVARIRPVPPALLDVRARHIAEAARDAAEAAVELARAELERAEAEAEYAGSELDRTRALLERGTAPERTLEQAQLDATEARAAVESARAGLLARERELESARATLMEHGERDEAAACCVEVRAPASGRVLRVLTESEQVVGAGTPLMEIGAPTDLEIVVNLLSSDAVRVAEGASAVITDWGGPDLPAQVRRIEPSAFTQVSALGIEEKRVTATLDLQGDLSRWAELGDGYRVTARIAVWKGEDLLAVPIGALFRSGADWAVYRVEDGRARLTRVEIGPRNEEWAEVRAGLEEGAQVVLHPSDRVVDSARITASAVEG